MTTTKELIKYLEQLPSDSNVMVISKNRVVNLDLDLKKGNYAYINNAYSDNKFLILGNSPRD